MLALVLTREGLARAADTHGTEWAAAARTIRPAPCRQPHGPAGTQPGLDPAAFLAKNDSTGFFDRLNDLHFTGPTHTNVTDFRAMLVDST